jgi:hypothetical protein
MFRQLLPALVAFPALTAGGARAQSVERLMLDRGTVLIIADTATGLDLWAARHPLPGEPASPDFVGWFDPDRLPSWLRTARALVAGPAPLADAVETAPLEATDAGFVTVVRLSSAPDAHPLLISFGHARERARWTIPVEEDEASRLLTLLERAAGNSRLRAVPELAYVNPTNRSATPDRTPGSPPPAYPRTLLAQGVGGQAWAMFDIGPDGAVQPGTLRLLWSDRPEFADEVRAALPAYRYQRRDVGRGPQRLRVYQRFRFTPP